MAEFRERFHIGNERKGKHKRDLTSHCLPGNLQEWYNYLLYTWCGGWGVGVTSQILLGVSFGADVNNLENVTIRNSAFLKSSPGIIFSMYN